MSQVDLQILDWNTAERLLYSVIEIIFIITVIHDYVFFNVIIKIMCICANNFKNKWPIIGIITIKNLALYIMMFLAKTNSA